MSAQSEPLLKADEVAVRLSISVSQVYALSREGRLPVVRVGRSVRWRPDDVARVMKSARVASNPRRPKPKPVKVSRLRTDWGPPGQDDDVEEVA